MSDQFLDEADNASTPLTPEERDALIPTHITLRRELNEVEHAAIDAAGRWAFSRKRDILSERMVRALHRRMFRDIWRWAGEFRTTPRNIGIDAWRIGAELRQLLEDIRFWIEHETWSPDEIAVRFHHRLVWIHPFPNGNGRLSRLAADLLARQLGRERFTWGSGNLIEAAALRHRYIDALRAADNKEIALLLAFVRS